MADSQEDIQAQLAEYIDGQLPPDQRVAIEEHLNANPSHLALVQELILQRDAIKSLPRAKAPMDLGDEIQGMLEREQLLKLELTREPRLMLLRPRLLAQAAIFALCVGIFFTAFRMIPGVKPVVVMMPHEEARTREADLSQEIADSSTPSLHKVEASSLPETVISAMESEPLLLTIATPQVEQSAQAVLRYMTDNKIARLDDTENSSLAVYQVSRDRGLAMLSRSISTNSTSPVRIAALMDRTMNSPDPTTLPSSAGTALAMNGGMRGGGMAGLGGGGGRGGMGGGGMGGAMGGGMGGGMGGAIGGGRGMAMGGMSGGTDSAVGGASPGGRLGAGGGRGGARGGRSAAPASTQRATEDQLVKGQPQPPTEAAMAARMSRVTSLPAAAPATVGPLQPQIAVSPERQSQNTEPANPVVAQSMIAQATTLPEARETTNKFNEKSGADFDLSGYQVILADAMTADQIKTLIQQLESEDSAKILREEYAPADGLKRPVMIILAKSPKPADEQSPATQPAAQPADQPETPTLSN